MNESERASEQLSDEIDLTRYLRLVRQWWRLIVLSGVIGGVITLGALLLTPKAYQATSNLIIVRTGTIFDFDTKIKSVSDIDQSSSTTSQDRGKSLAAVASSPEVASRVLAQIGDKIDVSLRDVEALQGQIQIENADDLIQVQALAGSPEQAALIANTWAQAYTDLANDVYQDNPVTLEALQPQADAAKREADVRQADLVNYLAQDPSAVLSMRLAEKQQILTGLQKGKDAAVQAIITKQQDADTRLLSNYLDAIVNTRSAVFNEQVTARIQSLNDLYTLKLKFERLLVSADSLRDRLDTTGTDDLRGDALAGMLLESSAFTTWADLPVSLQVPLSELTTGATPGAQREAIDSLIGVLNTQNKDIETQIDSLSKQLSENKDYQYLTDSETADTSQLRQAANAKVESLLRLEGLESVAKYDTSSTDLFSAMGKLQGDINQLQAQLEDVNGKKEELTRARDLARSTYNTLANKLAETNLAEQSKGSIVRIATVAIPPQQPVSRHTAIITFLGALAGVFVGVVLAFILDRFFPSDQLLSTPRARWLDWLVAQVGPRSG